MKVDLAQLKTSWGGVLVVLVDKLNTQNPRRREKRNFQLCLWGAGVIWPVGRHTDLQKYINARWSLELHY